LEPDSGTGDDRLDIKVDQREYNSRAISQSKNTTIESSQKGPETNQGEVLDLVEGVLVLVADSFISPHLVASEEVNSKDHGHVEDREKTNPNDIPFGAEPELDDPPLRQEGTELKHSEK
jgi:hypothetical protein